MRSERVVVMGVKKSWIVVGLSALLLLVLGVVVDFV